MDLCNPQALLLFAAARLGISSRRIRLLATENDTALREWIEHARELPLLHARSYARRTADYLQSIGAKMVTMAECGYPPGLRRLNDPPAFLTYRGTIDFEGITIIGARTPPLGAGEFAFDLAYELGRATISGLALGIDAAVHRGSLSARFPTVAYVGTGVGGVYPAEHRQLQEEIIARGGGVASEHLPHEKVSHRNLVRRDRLQAAHGVAIMLIASEASGGAMHT
nr:DNA-protecting protein DprA [Candidatus Eremiobacteraeota bacterium]